MHLLFKTSGQEVYKWLWSWVTASQAQLLMNEALKGPFPAVAHAGGVKVNAFPLHVYHPMAL